MGPSIVIDGEARPRRRSLRVGCASMGPSIVIDGEAHDLGRCHVRIEASMGPSIVIDGESARSRCSSSAGSGFNGAVDRDRRRGCSREQSLASMPVGFNGAVDRDRRRGSLDPLQRSAV